MFVENIIENYISFLYAIDVKFINNIDYILL
jgi:hypothetical protein